MKQKLLLFLLFYNSITLFAQETKEYVTAYDSLGRISDAENYYYLRVVFDYYTTKDLYEVKEFYNTEVLKKRCYSKNKNNLVLDGFCVDYYENGNKKQESNYIDNNLNGKQYNYFENGDLKSVKDILYDEELLTSEIKIIQFWNDYKVQKVIDGNGEYEEYVEGVFSNGGIKNGIKNGVWTGNDTKQRIKFTETYEAGKLISGISTDKDNVDYNYTSLIEMASPQKGWDDFFSYFNHNLKLNLFEKNNSAPAKMIISFIVDTNGKVIKPRIIRAPYSLINSNIISFITKYKKWNVGKRKGINSDSFFMLPIIISNEK